MQLIIRGVCCTLAEASAATVRETDHLVRIQAPPGDVSEGPDTDVLQGFDVILKALCGAVWPRQVLRL